MTTLKKRLAKLLKEGHDSSKEMIASNTTTFEDMGMSNTAPGEFAQEEITDHSNLENTGRMANDTDFGDKCDSKCCDPICKVMDTMDDLASDIVDISVKDDEDFEDEDETDIEDVEGLIHKVHESVNTSILSLVRKTLKETAGDDYAGPQDFVPDSRINASAVLNALKKEIGEGSEGIHVDQDQDDKDKKIWTVTQIDEDKLPKTLSVINVELERDGNVYKVKEMRKDFPAMK